MHVYFMISFSVPQVVLFWFFTLSKRAPDRGQEKVQKQVPTFGGAARFKKTSPMVGMIFVQIQEIGPYVIVYMRSHMFSTCWKGCIGVLKWCIYLSIYLSILYMCKIV